MEATVFLGTFNAADLVLYSPPDLCLDTILSWSSTDNSFELMWTPIKDDQWKQDVPELNFKSHSKESEYLCKYGISVFYF